MTSYEQEIETINDKMEKLEQDGIILVDDLSFNKQQKIRKNKWTYDCLKLYKNILEVINHLGIIDKDSFIQPFHESRLLNDDNSFNIHNFHEYIKKDEKGLFNKLLAHPEKPLQLHSKIGEALNNFLDTVEKEPQPIVIKYEKMVYKPIELQKELKRIIADENKKTETPLIKILKEYLDLFINDDYYNEVELFFEQMYNFCENDTKYKQSISGEREINALRERNKLDFLELLFDFFLISTSSKYKVLLNFTYPIYIEQSFYYYQNLCIEGYKTYRKTQKSLIFFAEKNNNDFYSTTQNFINNNNKFFNGKISKVKKEIEFRLYEAKKLKAANAVLDCYHMQEQYKSIDSVFNFKKIDRAICSNKLKANMKSIKEKLEKKYKDTQYADIPDLFEELLKKQEIFFKISDAEIPENLDEDYFDFNCNYSTGIIFSKLTTKYNPEGVNEVLENFETIVYNAAARVSDPSHFPKKQIEDYFKQLTIFFPEVYEYI